MREGRGHEGGDREEKRRAEEEGKEERGVGPHHR